MLGDIISGITGFFGAEQAADAQADAARISAAAFRPYSIASNLGDLNVNYATKKIDLRPSAADAKLRQQFFGGATQDVSLYRNNVLKLLDQLAARGEADARRTTQEGLFRAGRLGTYAGTRQIGEVERAIADARLNRIMQADQMAQQRRQTAFSNYLQVTQLPLQLASLSRNTNPAAPVAAQAFANAGSMQAAGTSALLGGFSSAVQQPLNTWFNNTGVGQSISNIFNPAPQNTASNPFASIHGM